ncbi:hypothetical protein JCM10908_006877 [Rhodotorula pacifica]|uniref:uncharacterized protein n=1 Tax=Rhodotorula pacifica TaxID=1495444 RepID=UPI00316F6CCF
MAYAGHRYAVVTLVTSDSYLPGALVALNSLLDAEGVSPSPTARNFATVCLATPATLGHASSCVPLTRDNAAKRFPPMSNHDNPEKEKSHQARQQNGLREALFALAALIEEKLHPLYETDRQTSKRLDRTGCTIEIALLDDLCNLNDFLKNDRQMYDGAAKRLSPANITKMSVALVWPLNAVIAGSISQVHTLSMLRLLAGLPDGIAHDYRSLEDLIRTRDLFRRLLHTKLVALAAEMAEEDLQGQALTALRAALKNDLHFGADESSMMTQVAKLDCEFLEQDNKHATRLAPHVLLMALATTPLTT